MDPWEGARPVEIVDPDGGNAVRLLTDLIVRKVGLDDTDGAVSFHEVVFEPSGGPPLHAHAELEIFYVVEGEVDFTAVIDGERRSVKAGPGYTAFIPPWAPHTYSTRTGAKTVLVAVPGGIERFFEEIGHPVADVNEPVGEFTPPDEEHRRLHREAAERAGHVFPQID
jgi:quercetin dioxygenase-like cupin family protein